MIVGRVLKVDNPSTLFLGFAVGSLDGNGDTVPDKSVFFLVDLNQRGGGKVLLHLFLGLVQLGGGEPRVQALQRLPKIPSEQYFTVACPAEGAVLAQLLRIVGIGDLPAQLPLQQAPGRFLDENVFGVVVAHRITFSVYSALAAFTSMLIAEITSKIFLKFSKLNSSG